MAFISKKALRRPEKIKGELFPQENHKGLAIQDKVGDGDDERAKKLRHWASADRLDDLRERRWLGA